jgi:hypothetical protein
MITESARMSTAKEATFRVQYANSRPRAIKVIGLDAPAVDIVRRVAAQRQWANATFFTSLAGEWDPKRPPGTPVRASLTDIEGNQCDLVEEIATADLIVMLCSAGESADAASLVAELCSMKRVMITGLLLKPEGSTDAELAHTLKSLRPFAPMLVISSGEDYVGEMLGALRA